MKKILSCLLVAVVLIVGAKYFYDSKISVNNGILYENKDIGVGFLIPEGYKENPYDIKENFNNTGTVIDFLVPESKSVVFSLYNMDKSYWENEVKENFSMPYSEIYSDENKILLYINPTDVQYDLNNTEQYEKYMELFELKEKVLEGMYFIK